APSLPPQQRTSCVVLCPANLLPVKGHEHLLRAMELLKHNGVRCTLRVAGDGALQNKLQCLADELRLGSMVEFLGGVPHDRILEWYRRRLVDAVVLPSVDLGEGVHEGIPVSLMEAMAHGLPVISTTTGGIPELLHDGAGIMTPPKDPAALAEAIERLIRDPDLRTRLGAAGRKRIEEEFAVQSVVEKLLAEIEAA
ncbi:MAG: glycosyltransferase, partial [Pirellulales bacterium]|nr:glycosyltransferase [Pirellulales bacterium]